MSIASVNLLKERVLRAAFECVDELEAHPSVVHTKGSRALVRAVKALREETWRVDEAPALIKELLQIIELQPEQASILGAKIKNGSQESVLRAKAFLGERKVEDDTTPFSKPRRGILRRAE
jgi:hypothetical protein